MAPSDTPDVTSTCCGQPKSLVTLSFCTDTVFACRLNRTMQEFWDDGRRLVFVSSVPTGDSRLWWPPASIHNSYANSDEVEVMWYYNRDVLSTYSPNATQFFKYAPHLTYVLTRPCTPACYAAARIPCSRTCACTETRVFGLHV